MSMYIEDEITQGYIKDQIKSHTKSHNDKIKGDLISRSAVIDTILTENQRCITSTGHEMSISMICNFILNQPTAYNVDAVVEQLEEKNY